MTVATGTKKDGENKVSKDWDQGPESLSEAELSETTVRSTRYSRRANPQEADSFAMSPCKPAALVCGSRRVRLQNGSRLLPESAKWARAFVALTLQKCDSTRAFDADGSLHTMADFIQVDARNDYEIDPGIRPWRHSSPT